MSLFPLWAFVACSSVNFTVTLSLWYDCELNFSEDTVVSVVTPYSLGKTSHYAYSVEDRAGLF